MKLLSVVVALPCEAKALIKFYKLKKNYACSHFALYCNEVMNLCVSGVGKLKAAACVGFLQQYCPAVSYLNLGIAGSGAHGFGAVVVANKIHDIGTEKNYYPFTGLNFTLPSTQVETHERRVSHYPVTGVVEMEASGFFTAATCFVAQELVHCIKIVSDTNPAECQALESKLIDSLIEKSFDSIQKVIAVLMDFAQQEFLVKHPQNEAADFKSRWHFTQYQTNQLTELLRRLSVLHQKPLYPLEAKSAKEVLVALQHQIQHLNYVW